jgi:hypothetical protein
MNLPDFDDVRRRADNLEWASAGEPWDYDTDALPESAYADWVRLWSPAAIVALLDRIVELELNLHVSEGELKRVDVAPTSVGGTDG